MFWTNLVVGCDNMYKGRFLMQKEKPCTSSLDCGVVIGPENQIIWPYVNSGASSLDQEDNET